MQEINKTSNKQPLPGLTNVDFNSMIRIAYNNQSIKDDAQFSCTEFKVSGTGGFNLEVVRPLPKAPPR